MGSARTRRPVRTAATTLAAGTALSMLFSGVALADNVVNNIVVGGNDTITVGGTTLVGYKINATGGDGQNGCNATDGSPVSIVLSVPSGVTASGSTLQAGNKLTFASCNAFQYVSFGSAVAGDYSVTVSSVSDTGIGTYSNQANWVLDVNPPPNTAPTVSVTGINASSYVIGNEPTPRCSVVDAEQPEASAAPTFDRSGVVNGLGTVNVSCSFIDNGGLNDTDTASYTIVPPPNSAPQVVVTGVTNGATYEAGVVPIAACSVTDEDATASATPVVGAAGLNGEGVGSQTVSCSYTDGGGLTGSASVTYSIEDTIAPTLSGLPSDITQEATSAAGAVVSWNPPTASGRTGETRSVSCLPASGSTFPIDTTQVSCTASDGSGNQSSAQTFTVTVRDTTAPTLSNMPGNQTLTATSRNGAVATWTAPAATDLVDPNATISCSAASGATFGLGTTTVSCTASDADDNTSVAKTFTVNVSYSATGALQPINSNGSSVFKLGSTVPVKFQLTNASAGITNAVASIKTAKLSGGVPGAETEAVTSTAASTGSAFRYDATSGQYIYNWGTKGLSDGVYQIRVDLGDGKMDRVVNVTLRR